MKSKNENQENTYYSKGDTGSDKSTTTIYADGRNFDRIIIGLALILFGSIVFIILIFLLFGYIRDRGIGSPLPTVAPTEMVLMIPTIATSSTRLQTPSVQNESSRTADPTYTPYPTHTPYPTNTLIPSITSAPIPQMDRFLACPSECNSDGANAITSFPEGVTELWVSWRYSNVPFGASYVRKWTNAGREWVRYQCKWPGTENGVENIRLWDVGGLHSGEWIVTVLIDGVIVLQESVFIEGNHTYWEPAGTIYSCYGSR